MTKAEPFYLRIGGGIDVFAISDRPISAAPGSTGVLIVPPWGWDETASYRSRRAWAERLAAAGHPVLRIDLPGTGDSEGEAGSPDLVDRWIEAIVAGVAWLRSDGGAARVALLGIGLGGLLAEEALGRGLVAEDLVVWGAAPSARHLVREARAFAAMQAGRLVDRSRDSPLPEGWLEAGGFVLSAATIAALKGLKAEGAPSGGRALLLGRDGIADEAGRERLESAGVTVSEGPGVGWGLFVGHPETTEMPSAVEGAVRTWLDEGGGGSGEPPTVTGPEVSPAAAFAERGAGDATFEEQPLKIGEDFGNAFGVLATPRSVADPDFCAVFLNAGAIRHIGPNRMWVEAARELAGRGIRSARLDLESIGEADGDPTTRATVADFYDDRFVAQVTAALDELERRGAGRRFQLIGLCAGAYWSFRTALADDRVEGVVLLNSGALVWHPGILDEREGRRVARALDRHWWARLLRGQVRLSSVRRLFREAWRGGRLKVRRIVSRSSSPSRRAIVADLDRLPPDRRVLMAFSAGEALAEELHAVGILGRLEDWPGVEVVTLPGADHTLRSVVAQRAAAELLRRAVPGRGQLDAGLQR
jgi:alpha-beta hydrolase superfamily lysophospholipase